MFGEELWTCPRRPILDAEDDFVYWLSLYKDYRKGIMPEEGGRLNQAAVVLDVFMILDGVYAEIDQYHRDEAERKRSMNDPGGVPRMRG